MKTFKQFFIENIIAYHGTGMDFNKFDIDKVGSGESVSKYGYGLYFTTDEEIATFYAQRAAGSKKYVYKVDLFNKRPNLIKFENNILDYVDIRTLALWSKELNGKEEIEKIYNDASSNIMDRYFEDMFVRVLINNRDEEAWDKLKEMSQDNEYEFDWNILYKLLQKADFELYPEEDTFTQLYSTLTYAMGNSEKNASMFLKKHGIDGIVFDSYEKGKDVQNYVIFDNNDVKIIDKEEII